MNRINELRSQRSNIVPSGHDTNKKCLWRLGYAMAKSLQLRAQRRLPRATDTPATTVTFNIWYPKEEECNRMTICISKELFSSLRGHLSPCGRVPHWGSMTSQRMQRLLHLRGEFWSFAHSSVSNAGYGQYTPLKDISGKILPPHTISGLSQESEISGID